MKDTKHIDRRSLLASSASLLATVVLGGCTDDLGTGRGDAAHGDATNGDAGHSGETGTGYGEAGYNDAGTDAGGGTGDAGAGGFADAGGTCTSVVEVVNDHTHVLTVPLSDVEIGYKEAPYLLEDGGAGHTHSLTITAYDFLYLQAGTVSVMTSSTDAGHAHQCTVTCAGS
jgi:hypothetical protein